MDNYLDYYYYYYSDYSATIVKNNTKGMYEYGCDQL